MLLFLAFEGALDYNGKNGGKGREAVIWAVIALGCIAAGIVQAVTGFGSVVFMMLVFPFFFDMIDAPALALVVNQLYCMALLWKYRHHIQWRIVLPPTILYTIGNFVVAQFVGGLDLRVLTIAFAVFLMALSVYFLLVARRIKVKPHPAVGVGVGIFSGITGGLFAIGGPPVALYMVSATDDYKSYRGCMQFLFTVTGIGNLAGRFFGGVLHAEILPYAAVGTVCILLGALVGNRIVSRLNADTFRLAVYLFVGISGVILLLQNI